MNWLLIATTVFIVLAITCYAIVLGYTVNTLDTRWEIISPQVKKTSLFSFIGTVLLIIVLSLFYTEHSKYSVNNEQIFIMTPFVNDYLK